MKYEVNGTRDNAQLFRNTKNRENVQKILKNSGKYKNTLDIRANDM